MRSKTWGSMPERRRAGRHILSAAGIAAGLVVAPIHPGAALIPGLPVIWSMHSHRSVSSGQIRRVLHYLRMMKEPDPAAR
ncbi:MAG: hypothetical protein OWS74_02930 [Firmicutes bacterium]|nr:hypothetical protein [Bacillota bacterium]